MADTGQLAILRHGAKIWNEWRQKNLDVPIDLSNANLRRINLWNADLWDADFSGADLEWAYLRKANLVRANFTQANLNGSALPEAELSATIFFQTILSGTNLRKADLSLASLKGADLSDADLTQAKLMGADLQQADLARANLSGADLTGANLKYAHLVGTQLQYTNLTNCHIFGISAWKLVLHETMQSNLIITDYGEPMITVDNLEIAQFVYLLLHNEKLRDVIDTIGKKAVLILGRFTDERKAVLEAIREELRRRDYIPILFDFEKPSSRDLEETIVTLAHLSRFVIADITDAKSITAELRAIAPNLLSVAVQPIILASQQEYALFDHIKRIQSVLPVYEYDSQDQLIAELADKVIAPAEAKVLELRPPTL